VVVGGLTVAGLAADVQAGDVRLARRRLAPAAVLSPELSPLGGAEEPAAAGDRLQAILRKVQNPKSQW
jgi:hypothetical protein